MMHPNEIKLTAQNFTNLWALANSLSPQHLAALMEQVKRQGGEFNAPSA